MNLEPITQKCLFGLDNQFNELTNLYKKNKLPTKILLSGPKGSGKCTLAYHLINFILSKDEELYYDLKNKVINENNISFRLINNKVHPNFYLLDTNPERKNIEINQIRELIKNLNKSSFNSKPRIILIDNIEFLNVNSINALLKILEEPNFNIFFILINNNKKILSTLKSRCLNFRVSLSNAESLGILDKLLINDEYALISNDLTNYYTTPGNIYNIIKLFKINDIDFNNKSLKEILLTIMEKNFTKKNPDYKNIIYDLFEFYLFGKQKTSNFNLYNYFINKINDTKNFNLDDETLFFEIKNQIINEQ